MNQVTKPVQLMIPMLTVGVLLPALVDVDAAVHAGPARQALALAAPHARRAVLARVGGGAGVHLVLTSCA